MIHPVSNLTLDDLVWRDNKFAEAAKHALAVNHGLSCVDDILSYATSELSSHITNNVTIWREFSFALVNSHVELDDDWARFTKMAMVAYT